MAAAAHILNAAAGTGGGTDGLIGQVLHGTYRILQVLDRGGMGTVFDAEHLRLGRRVAVKLVAEHLVRDEEVLARFRSEAEILSQLHHPHIVQVFDFNTTEAGQPFLVMELLHGESLATRLDRERLIPIAETVRIAGQVASALGAAHDAGIVHRDLKPANIFLVNVPGDAAFVKLLDFGISRRSGAAQRITRVRDVLGTPEYMAPEQAAGRTAMADHRADEYALGVIVYEMLAGHPPFQGADPIATLYQVVNEQPVALSRVAPPWVPSAVSDVVGRALSKQVEERYPDVHEFADALLAAAACCQLSPAPSSRPKSSPGGRYSMLPRADSERIDPPPTDVVELARPGSSARARARVIGSNTLRGVVSALDRGLGDFDAGRLAEAAAQITRALELAASSENDDVRDTIDAMRPQLIGVLIARLGGLARRLKLTRAAGGGENATEAFLLSCIDGNATLDEVLGAAPYERLDALRALVALRDRGAIGG
ncbi:MAG: serine/threonine-protein kinase [Sorangiineae bacterium]|nr:serine/threonine-protein kinase [Polyangiaceae bacterium]MEB2323539.1 serine/threonine-protein kinase [Sorangiineae bacterium]